MADPTGDLPRQGAFDLGQANRRHHGGTHDIWPTELSGCHSAVAGISANAAPVFYAESSMVLSLNLIGTSAALDTTTDSPPAQA